MDYRSYVPFSTVSESISTFFLSISIWLFNINEQGQQLHKTTRDAGIATCIHIVDNLGKVDAFIVDRLTDEERKNTTTKQLALYRMCAFRIGVCLDENLKGSRFDSAHDDEKQLMTPSRGF